MSESKQHELYREAGEKFAPAIARLAHAIERDPARARELEQDIHCELFRSFARYSGRCSLKTWVYRIAHNVAADHRLRMARQPRTVPLEEIADWPSGVDQETRAAHDHAVAEARALIRRLPTLDAQVMLLWLEGESGAGIAEITGLSVSAVNTRIHRLKSLIASRFQPPATDGDCP